MPAPANVAMLMDQHLEDAIKEKTSELEQVLQKYTKLRYELMQLQSFADLRRTQPDLDLP